MGRHKKNPIEEQLHEEQDAAQDGATITGDNLVKKSIILTEETWAIAQKLQDHLHEMSLSALVRHLLKTYGPGILSGEAPEPTHGSQASLTLHLSLELREMVTDTARRMEMDPGTLVVQMLIEHLGEWLDKARAKEQVIAQLQKKWKEQTPGEG